MASLISKKEYLLDNRKLESMRETYGKCAIHLYDSKHLSRDKTVANNVMYWLLNGYSSKQILDGLKDLSDRLDTMNLR